MHDVVSSPDPALKEGKGLVYFERFLGRAGCSMSCDWQDYALFWHGNASTPLTHSSRCYGYMIITCKPHGVNLIGATEFRNKPQKAEPKKRLMYTRPFPSMRVGSGNETMHDVVSGSTQAMPSQ